MHACADLVFFFSSPSSWYTCGIQVLKRTLLVYYHSPVRITEISWNFSSFIHTQGLCLIEIRQAKPIKSILEPTSSTQTRFYFMFMHRTNSLDSVYRYFRAIYYNKNQFAVKINRAPHFWQKHTHTHTHIFPYSLFRLTWKPGNWIICFSPMLKHKGSLMFHILLLENFMVYFLR